MPVHLSSSSPVSEFGPEKWNEEEEIRREKRVGIPNTIHILHCMDSCHGDKLFPSCSCHTQLLNLG